MSTNETVVPGSVVWRDLTVHDASALREFYADVVGWHAQPVAMGEGEDAYEDFAMAPAGAGDAVAGICHARGTNADLPPQWLIYVVVEDVERAARKCEELGGTVLSGPRGSGQARFCVIRDPAGAVLALYAPGGSA